MYCAFGVGRAATEDERATGRKRWYISTSQKPGLNERHWQRYLVIHPFDRPDNPIKRCTCFVFFANWMAQNLVKKSLFQEQEYLNGRFFQKRAFYSKIKTIHNVDVAYDSLADDPRLTSLVVIPRAGEMIFQSLSVSLTISYRRIAI
jgi:hypothetical protein